MKKLFPLTIALLIAATSGCNLFRNQIQMEQVIVEKENIDKTDNPAMQLLLRQELGKKAIVLNDVLVKDVMVSSNIDYDFCVIADVTTNSKKVECYIYSKNVKIMSMLVKGKTRINVTGDFGRFFTTLDDYYTKIEIVEAKIRIIEEEK